MRLSKRKARSSKPRKSQDIQGSEIVSSVLDPGPNRDFPSRFVEICAEECVLRVPLVVVTPTYGGEEFAAESELDHIDDRDDEDPVPVIRVTFDQSDKNGDVQKAAIKGFRLETDLLRAIGRCLTAFPTITSLRLEDCGLATDQLSLLARLVVRATTLRELSLDYNTLPGGDLGPLLDPRARLESLSLRWCGVSDGGALSLAGALAYQDTGTSPLLSLNLTCNSITCEGARHLAEALRTNRILVCLLLAGNRIGDDGASWLAESLQRFPLTHSEARLRRRKNIQRLIQQKDTGEQQSAGKMPRTTQRPQGSVTERASLRRESSSSKDRKKEKASAQGVSEGPLVDEHPFMQEVVAEGGELWCVGNRVLAHLSLAYNHVGSPGMKALLAAVKYQDSIAAPSQQKGLSRLVLEGNSVPEESQDLTELREISQSRLSTAVPVTAPSPPPPRRSTEPRPQTPEIKG
ncbi:uncharacterized protein LOC134533064 isoform X2 [Bacillus rossius redtenbacheri]|uniref:uncharacterized protein LOC134533064 isoform X2 n=1 Tax=Bacillus rossius redtenbacheri TaxID=93214 RepID=UPI002FDE405D